MYSMNILREIICLLLQRKHSAVTAQNYSVVLSGDVRFRSKKRKSIVIETAQNVITQGLSGSRTLDLSHPKRESCHWTNKALLIDIQIIYYIKKIIPVRVLPQEVYLFWNLE